MESHRDLQISAAEHGGYIVFPALGFGKGGDGYYRGPLFAGSLPDALEFMRKTLADRSSAEQA